MACGVDEFEHDRLMPSGFFELAAHGAFGLFRPREVQGHWPHNGEVFRPLLFAVSRAVFVHGDIQHPVQAVLNGPMSAGHSKETLG